MDALKSLLISRGLDDPTVWVEIGETFIVKAKPETVMEDIKPKPKSVVEAVRQLLHEDPLKHDGIKKLIAEVKVRFPALEADGVKVGSREVREALKKSEPRRLVELKKIAATEGVSVAALEAVDDEDEEDIKCAVIELIDLIIAQRGYAQLVAKAERKAAKKAKKAKLEDDKIEWDV